MSHLKLSSRLFCQKFSFARNWQALVWTCVLTASWAAKADEALHVPQLKTDDFVLDGELNDPVWQSAAKKQLNYVIFPFENTKPQVKTEAYIFQSEQHLYIAFQAHDPSPDNLHVHYRAHDKAWHDDNVGVKLDTFHDAKLAYKFFVNPYGTKLDATENGSNGKKSDSWDAIWDAAAKVNEQGYAVEMVIPLAILNLPESNGDKTWGVNFERHYPRGLKYYMADVPFDRNNNCGLCQMSSLSGIKAKSNNKDLTLVPAIVASSKADRDLYETRDWTEQQDVQVGMDINWGLSADTRLTATLNPDFSQIEADSAQLSLNNTFTLSLKEKRRFFLENHDFFDSKFNLIYTRNIADPDAGLKLTSRFDNHTVGVLVTNDSETNVLLPGNLNSKVETLDESSLNAAFRYRNDVSSDLSLGLVSTLRQSDSYHNYLFGLDGLYRFNKQAKLEMQWVASDSKNPLCLQDVCESSKLNSHAYRIDFNHNTRDWSFKANHQYRGKEFRADLGFETKADYVKSVIGGSKTWYLSNSWWNKVVVYSDYDVTHNTDNEFIENEWEANLAFNGNLQSKIASGVGKRNRVGPRQHINNLAIDHNTQQFSEQYFWIWAGFKPINDLFVSTALNLGQQIDNTYIHDSNDDGIREYYGREGQYFEPQINIAWDVNEHLNLNIKYLVNTLQVNDKDAFSVDLYDARVAYQFDSRHRLRFAVIYRDRHFNLNNYEFDRSPRLKDLASQVIYSYSVNPGTVAFFGYSDGSIEDQDDNITQLTQNQRSVFAKFSYAW